MKKILLAALLLGLGYWGVTDFVRSGKLERYLDAHPAPVRNAAIEYYWGAALRYIHHPASAEYRFRRVMKVYPETPYAPLAWFDLISMLEDAGNQSAVLTEAELFVEAYPDHHKAALARNKIHILKYGI